MPKSIAIFIPLLFGVVLIVGWYFVVVFLGRAFGIHLPLQPIFKPERRKVFQRLTFSQFVFFFGVLYFAGAMFLFNIGWDYIDWKYLDGAYRLNGSRLLRNAVGYLVGGMIFGMLSWWKPKTADHETN